MAGLLHIALKDLRLLSRDLFGLFWILIWPLVFALFFGSIFGGGGGEKGSMKIGVVDEDGTPGSRAFAADLGDSDALQLVDLDFDAAAASEGGEPRTELELARTLVRKGKLTAFVRLAPGFGASMGPLMGGPGTLEVGVDPARNAEKGMLQGVVMEAGFLHLRRRIAAPDELQADLRDSIAEVEADSEMGLAEKLKLLPFLKATDVYLDALPPELLGGGGVLGGGQLAIEAVATEGDKYKSSWEITFPAAVLWGLIGAACGMAITLVQERKRGTWLRLRVSPCSRFQLLAGKGLACFVACLGVGLVLLGFAKLVFSITIDSYLLLGLGVASTAFAFSGLMMVLSVLGRTEQAVAGASWGLMMPLAMLGGGMLPLAFMPAWMQSASHFSPVKWGIVALEGAVWRGYDLADMLLPCSILLGVGVLGMAVGAKVLARYDG